MIVDAGDYLLCAGPWWLEFGLVAEDGVIDALFAVHVGGNHHTSSNYLVENDTDGGDRPSWNSSGDPFRYTVCDDITLTRVTTRHRLWDKCCQYHMMAALGADFDQLALLFKESEPPCE